MQVSDRTRWSTFLDRYASFVRGLVYAMTAAAAGGIVLMMLVTCADILLRLVGKPIPGVYDIVRLCGAVTIACALPYTTAVKGHVAIEHFFLMLSRRGRIVVDSAMRLLCIALFGVFSWQCVVYGRALRQSGQVTSTLQLPLFWVPYLMAASSVVVVLVIIHNLFHPGREMIKP
jgi:TRAP-type C4-dicarboxylate transport system permease small subunit